MNKNRFRIVFNAARGLRVAVAECAGSFGKASTTVCAAVSLFAAPLFAQIVADPGAPSAQRPTVLTVPNNVPLINIQTPSAAGVSRNTYSQFDVNAHGAILNNSRTNVQTQLGGWVQGNPWLATGGARVILNEVNSTNPSQLRGFVEVAGQRAEVIIANPAGINVNGGGFINASRATLTTGTPIMNGGALDGYRVQRGSVTVGGAGLDARQTDHTAILARAIEVNAGIWANDLKLVTGANDVSADQTSVQAQPAGTGTAPAFALDVANLGGMYAGKITLVGTEAGLGVRNAGTIGASAGDVVIDANGWLSNKGSLQASANLSIHMQGEVRNEKDIYAGSAVSIKTQQAVTNSGQVNAEGNVLVQAAATENGVGARIASNAAIQMHSSGAQLNQGVIVSAGSLNLQAAQLDNEGRLLSTAGNMNVTSQGEVSNTGPAAQMYAAGQQHIQASGALTNSGLIAAAGDLTVRSDSVNSTGSLAAGLNTDGSLKTVAALLDVLVAQQLTAQGNNLASGHLSLGGQALDISDSQVRAQTMSLRATGRGTQAAPGTGLIDADNADLLAHRSVAIDGTELRTTDAQLQALGSIDIEVEQLNNRAGLIRSGGSLTAIATQIDNRDTRTAAGAAPLGLVAQSAHLTIGELLNQSGAIVAAENLTVIGAGAGAGNHQIANSQGMLSAGTTLDIHEATAASPATARRLTIQNTAGTLIADQRLAVTARSLSLDGEVLSQQDMVLSVQGDHTHAQGSRIVANRDLTLDIEDGGLRNSGALLAGRNLGFTATSLENTVTGEISAGTTTNIEVTEALTNRGLIDGKNSLLRAQDLSNIGTGRIYGDVLAIQANTLLNDTETVGGVRKDAIIAARNRLDIGVQTLVNREGAAIFSAGDMAIGGALDANRRADGATSGMAQAIQNQSATIEALDALAIATQTLENTNTHFVADLVAGPTTQVLKIVHNGVSYDPQDLGMNFGPVNSYVDNAGFRLLLPSADYPFSVFPADIRSWAARDTGVQIEFGLGELMSNDFGPRVASPFAVDYSRRRIRECRDCEWQVVDNYTAGHGIWARFGVTPYDPASGDAALKSAAQDQLDQRIAAYNLSVGARTLRDWTVIDATSQEFTPIVRSSRPAQLLAGGNLSIHSTQELVNDKSEIVAGGTLGITGAGLRNIDADVLARTQVQGQSVYSYYIEDCGFCDADRGHQFTAYAAETTRTVGLPVSRVEQRTALPASSLQIGVQTIGQTGSTTTGAVAPAAGAPGNLAALAPIVLPTSALFRPPASSTANYLTETDPRFTDHRQWLSSDYLLQAMSIDPATTQKRLGDGFYEQRLLREQIASLTGQRFLDSYTTDEAQYQALMTNGATFAQAFQLRPGVALSAEQVARLTSDIVWLVERPVLLPDGSTVMALVPQVYLMPREGELSPTGSLLAGAQVQLDLSGDLTHAGTIAGRDVTRITAQNIHQLGGLTTGTTVHLNARDDLNVIGGQIVAQDRLDLQAGGDMSIRSTTQSTGDPSTSSSRTTLDRVAALYVTNPNGVLVAMAGGNLTAQGAAIRSEGNVHLQALGDIALSTVSTEARDEARWDERNHLSLSERSEIGSTVTAAGGVTLEAGGGVTARAANLQADGALELQAGGSVLIEAGERTKAHDEAHHVESGRWLSSTSTTTRNSASETQAIASDLGGQTVTIRSDQNVGIHGSNVIGDQGVTVEAVGDVKIVAAQTQFSQSDYKEVETSGFSFGDASVSWGTQNQSKDLQSQGTGSVASTVGAISGNVNITAGETYTQVGSDVMAPGGDVNILARDIAITEARESQYSRTEEKFKQAGISLGVSSPLISAVQRMASTAEATDNTNDARMQALGAATLALQGKQVLDSAAQIANADNPAQAAGVSISISLGSSQSESLTETRASGSRGSTLTAGGDINLIATGAGQDSTLLIQGSDIIAGDTARLIAEGDVTLQASRNDREEHNRQSNSSASVGIGFGVGAGGTGFGLMVSASQGKGQGDGFETVHRNTHVSAGNLIVLDSGGDTTLKGAVAQAEQIKAHVGGDLHIESLQDTATYNESSENAGFSAMIGAGGGGSINAGKTKIDSDYASVNEQSGIRAGDGGFQVSVQGSTSLKGGAITSADKAVQDGLNRFDSLGDLELSNIQNSASYKANSSGVTIGAGSQLDSSGAGIGSDKGSASSTTVAAISGIAGNTEARTGDAETGITAIFDKERVKDEVNAQVEITKAFGQQAVKSGAAFADDKAIELRRAGNEDEARKWDEGGEYRVALHAGIGLLGGGIAGAVGAASGAALMPALGEEIAGMNLPESVRQGLTQVVGAVLGSAAGGAAGAATSLNQTAHNYVSHSPFASVRRTVSQENARLTNECAANCTAEDFRRIDQQMAALERAGDLSEIAQRSTLSTHQATQLAQLLTELAPGYGNGESLLQLITGKSSLTGEETSRFWAAVGVIPVAGGILRKVAEPSADMLAAVLRNNFYRDGGDPGVLQQMFESAAKNSTHNASAQEVVLGRYIDGSPESYEQVAKNRGATYFEMPDWGNVQSQIGADQMWNINKAFLDQQITQGKNFVFTGDPTKARLGSYTDKEFNHLMSSGYEIIEDTGGYYRATKK